jgi:hypothetical protein
MFVASRNQESSGGRVSSSKSVCKDQPTFWQPIMLPGSLPVLPQPLQRLASTDN